MAKTVEFFFDFGSPTSYLAWTQLPKLAAECGAQLVWRPMLLRWMFQDMGRWAQRHGVGLAMNPHFPINTLTLMRVAVGLQMRRPADFERYVDTVFRAMWEAPRNLGDAAVLSALLQSAGFDAEALLALAGDAEVKARLAANTDEAVARGVFGAPTMFVGEQMFFGQDRLDFVREALR
jgi:2-hydroxychromene-2-carboxylate isomerase